MKLSLGWQKKSGLLRQKKLSGAAGWSIPGPGGQAQEAGSRSTGARPLFSMMQVEHPWVGRH